MFTALYRFQLLEYINHSVIVVRLRPFQNTHDGLDLRFTASSFWVVDREDSVTYKASDGALVFSVASNWNRRGNICFRVAVMNDACDIMSADPPWGHPG